MSEEEKKEIRQWGCQMHHGGEEETPLDGRCIAYLQIFFNGSYYSMHRE